MYKVLYRAYRPETFGEMLGQKHIVKILRNQIKNDAIHHAYLFSGTRGTGKTTTARLLAKAINCLSREEEKPCGVCKNCTDIKNGTFIDIIEIDAASNNGVDNIRELRDSMKYYPVVGKKKVYIIDEVHMLSSGAYNAFLKTLEEPPPYVVFILATTEVHKLPATILSRCLRLDFRRVPEKEIVDSLNSICIEQGMPGDENALKLIAANADGSVRDALTLLDQCISIAENEIKREDVLNAIGTVGSEIFINLTESALDRNVAKGISIIDEILSEGRDARQIMSSWLQHYRNVMLIKHLKSPEEVLNMSIENIERLKKQSLCMDMNEITRGINIIADTMYISRTSSQPRILLEIAFVKLCDKNGEQQEIAKESSISSVKISKEEISSIANSGNKREEDEEVIQGFKKEINNVSKFDIDVDVEKNESLPGGDDNDAAAYVVASNNASSGEFKDIWKKMIDEGEKTYASAKMLSFGVNPIEINEKEFILQISKDSGISIGIYLEKNKTFIEELFKKCTGESKEMIIQRQDT